MSEQLEQGFKLGACEIRPAEHCVINNGSLNHIEPKSMAVLLELVANGNDTVSREALISVVWPRGFVTDDVLNRCVSQIRTALGDNPKAPTYIATVPRKGYRMVATVEDENTEATEGVLVLPFQNLAAHGKDEYLADGLTELLITRLAVALDQRVISRTTSMSYKGTSPDMRAIGQALDVKWLVEGSLLHLGDQLQVVVQLIDASTDSHAWAETWTRPVEDILSVLNEVTRQVSNQIQSRLNSKDVTAETEIALPDELMRRYLQGLHHVSKRSVSALRLALKCFDEVLEEYPGHTHALAGVAMCHIMLVHYNAETVVEGMSKARLFSQRALEVDPGNADALSHLGAVHFYHDWNFERAGELAGRALEIKPNYEMALLLAAVFNLVNGRYEQSQALLDRAIATDPLNVGLLMNAGDVLILQRRYGEAVRSLSQALELAPHLRPAYMRLALAHALNGQHQQASEALGKALEPGEKDAAYHEYKALVAGQAGHGAEALEAAKSLQQIAGDSEKVLPWSLARAWAAAGDRNRALNYLQQAFETRSSSMPFLGQSPVFQSIRSDPEVQDLMRKVGLPV